MEKYYVHKQTEKAIFWSDWIWRRKREAKKMLFCSYMSGMCSTLVYVSLQDEVCILRLLSKLHRAIITLNSIQK